jgi:hypothetical protein
MHLDIEIDDRYKHISRYRLCIYIVTYTYMVEFIGNTYTKSLLYNHS